MLASPTNQWQDEPRPAAARAGHRLLAALLLLSAGCAPTPDLPGGPSLDHPLAIVAPPEPAIARLDTAVAAYRERDQVPVGDLAGRIDLRTALIHAVQHNRRVKRQSYAAQRLGLQRTIEQRDLDQPFLNAAYSVNEGPDAGDARVSATGRWAGFEVEPFVRFLYDEQSDEQETTTYGVAVSRNLFRILYEDLRQHLPLTQATRDFHAAINERILELRRLHLAVVEAFYDIHRLSLRVDVRRHRVEDARAFLAIVETKVENGMSAPVEITNARISLNQAETDLVSEQTSFTNASDVLLDLLGAPLGRQLEIAPVELGAAEPMDADLEADLDLVRSHHERVRNQLLDMEVQRQELLVTDEAVRPDLDATLSASRDVDGDRDDVTLGLFLSVPLDNFSAERARSAQARLRLMEMRTDLASIRSELERVLRRQHRTIAQLLTTVRLETQRLEAERAKLDATLKSYERGAIVDNLEVTRAKAAVDQAEVDLLDSRIRLVVEEARYQATLPAPEPDAVAPDAADTVTPTPVP